MTRNIAYDKSLAFAITIVHLCRKLQADKEYVLSKQLLRSGTSIGANIAESISAHTKKEFYCKLAIALKEARETAYWLNVLKLSDSANQDYSLYLEKVEEIIKLLCSSTRTIKKQLEE